MCSPLGAKNHSTAKELKERVHVVREQNPRWRPVGDESERQMGARSQVGEPSGHHSLSHRKPF